MIDQDDVPPVQGDERPPCFQRGLVAPAPSGSQTERLVRVVPPESRPDQRGKAFQPEILQRSNSAEIRRRWLVLRSLPRDNYHPRTHSSSVCPGIYCYLHLKRTSGTHSLLSEKAGVPDPHGPRPRR